MHKWKRKYTNWKKRLKTTPNSLWISSGFWDFSFILSTFWILGVFVVLQALNFSSESFIYLTAISVVLLSGGHLVAPLLTLFLNSALRTTAMQFPVRFIFIPIALLLMIFLCNFFALLYRESGGVNINLLFLVASTYFLWNTWHFAAQHFGILSFYRVKAKQLEKRDRNFDYFFALFPALFLMPLAWYIQGRRLGFFIEWEQNPQSSAVLKLFVSFVAICLFLAYSRFELRKKNFSIPKLLYYLTIVIQPVFVSLSYTIFSLAVYSIPHWIIEIALISKGNANYFSSKAKGFNFMFASFVAGLVLISILFHFKTIFPWSEKGIRLDGHIFGFSGHENSWEIFGIALWTAVLMSVNLLHFYFDRFLYNSRSVLKNQFVSHLL